MLEPDVVKRSAAGFYFVNHGNGGYGRHAEFCKERKQKQAFFEVGSVKHEHNAIGARQAGMSAGQSADGEFFVGGFR